MLRLSLFTTLLLASTGLATTSVTLADAPPFSDYCQRLQQEIQGKKHGFLAGNVTYYVGGFHANWEPKEHETLGLTNPIPCSLAETLLRKLVLCRCAFSGRLAKH